MLPGRCPPFPPFFPPSSDSVPSLTSTLAPPPCPVPTLLLGSCLITATRGLARPYLPPAHSLSPLGLPWGWGPRPAPVLGTSQLSILGLREVPDRSEPLLPLGCQHPPTGPHLSWWRPPWPCAEHWLVLLALGPGSQCTSPSHLHSPAPQHPHFLPPFLSELVRHSSFSTCGQRCPRPLLQTAPCRHCSLTQVLLWGSRGATPL